MIPKITSSILFLIIITCLSCVNNSANQNTISTDSSKQNKINYSDSISKDTEVLVNESNFYEEIKKQLVKANESWFMVDTAGITQLSLVEFMNKLLPQVNRYAESNSKDVFYNNLMQKRFPAFDAFYSSSYGDTSQMPLNIVIDDFENSEALLIGKFIDGKQTFAIAYDIKKTNIEFYRLANGKWKKIGSKQQEKNWTYQRFFLEEINNKPGLEIVMATHPNMNGNMFMELFYYSEKEDKITFAGISAPITKLY
ncbi:MAG: hypothetical protein ACOVOQ_12575 [Flavobacterium sp.]